MPIMSSSATVQPLVGHSLEHSRNRKRCECTMLCEAPFVHIRMQLLELWTSDSGPGFGTGLCRASVRLLSIDLTQSDSELFLFWTPCCQKAACICTVTECKAHIVRTGPALASALIERGIIETTKHDYNIHPMISSVMNHALKNYTVPWVHWTCTCEIITYQWAQTALKLHTLRGEMQPSYDVTCM